MIDKNSTFGGFLTDVGEAKQANANALGQPWKLTHMLLGDANGTDPVPQPGQSQLINKVYRAAINQLFVDPANPSILIAELVLPPNVGGWWIRELGLEDEDGDFVAVANCPPSYKPLLAQGSGRNQVVRMHLIVSNTANVQLKIDPSVVLATRKYVDDVIEAHIASRDHPTATTTQQGMTRLATSEETRQGTRTDRSTHPAGVRFAIEKALSAFTTRKYVDDVIKAHNASRDHPTATITQQGMTRLATSEETRQGTRTDRSTHPAGVKFAIEKALSAFTQFPAGTRMIFQQPAAPSGWTKDTDSRLANTALRIVTGGGGGFGGSVAFSTAFQRSRGVSGSVGNHTLNINRMPSHGHRATGNGGMSADANNPYGLQRGSGTTVTVSGEIRDTGGNQSHSHSWSGSVNLDVKYVDVIVCQKD